LKYICIEGNIGSGKTTLAKALSKQVNAFFLPERFEKNNFLQLSYHHPKQYAFVVEFHFLIERYNEIFKTVNNRSELIVSDYSFYKCLWFAKINLSKKDFEFFKKSFQLLCEHLPKPDAIIYLNAETKLLKKNILKRGRDYEKNISETYLASIKKSYFKGLKALKNIPQLHINITHYNKQLEKHLIKEVKDFIKIQP
jgi:deoxyguanosine kinase